MEDIRLLWIAGIRKRAMSRQRTLLTVSHLAEGRVCRKVSASGYEDAVVGRIQTGSYTNKDGSSVYTTDVVAEEQEFAESKAAASQRNTNGSQSATSRQDANDSRHVNNNGLGVPDPTTQADNSGFMQVTDDTELPFST